MRDWLLRAGLGCIVAVATGSSFAETPHEIDPAELQDSLRGDIGVVAGGEPDVVVSSISGINKYGSVAGITGYAIGTTSCNIGTAWAEWFSGSNNHPLIAQNLYRLQDGRFEQIGQSWLKHGWCAADGGSCTAAGGPPSCSSAGGCDWLGIGCTDTYGAGLNGDQFDLGPRSEVNASTGAYPYPYQLNWGQSGNATFKRMQVKDTDLDPANTATAIFVGESQYVTTDESQVSRTNNSTWRRVNRSTTFNNGYTLDFTGAIVPRQTALEAWPQLDAGVTVLSQDIAGDGRFWLGYKVTDNGDGTWNYEYALHNMNSHRSASSFSVPSEGVATSNHGFHDVDYHSGEPYDGTDWPANDDGTSLTWATDSFATNPNANALRWGTLYNYRFTADSAPTMGQVEVGLFRPGTPSSILFDAMVPTTSSLLLGDMNCDGLISVSDIGPFVLALTDPAGYAAQLPACDINAGDLNGDNMVSVGDIGAFVALLAP